MAHLYRSGSPVFDISDYPQLRRVKPLPKRRRMSDHIQYQQLQQHAPPNIADLQTALGQSVDAEEFAAHADALSTQLALQSFYMPMLNEGFDFIQANLSHMGVNGNGSGTASFDPSQMSAMAPSPRDHSTEGDEHGDGDYVDHLMQPGHTKKRKVPATNLDSPGGHEAGGTVTSAGEEDFSGGGGVGNTAAGVNPAATPLAHYFLPRKGRTSTVTKASLQHKEMLKNRKRQLAAVLGAHAHGDSFVLDQALSTKYPFAKSTFVSENLNANNVRVRPSRRPWRRLARRNPLTEGRILTGLPDGEFLFYFPSATLERLSATKEEVAVLHARFEVELARQAAKAAEAAKAAALAASKIAKKTAQRSQSRPKAITGPRNSGSEEPSVPPGKARTGKKKKRSALANASNPHHLRNYVPSRLPNSGPPPASQENLLFPFPLRFLSADIPPHRRQKPPPATVPAAQLANPYDEWICPFCESSLFYGDEQEYTQSVRSRKKILLRRRRARERAAATASGAGHQGVGDKNGSAPINDENPGFDPAYVEADAYGKEARIATGRGESGGSHGLKDRDKDEEI